ncbi:NUDIX domain-containing protein [Solibacillus sp. CAU 1738]|uniref:NUDIX domain-containing protein n=1 Tax=Solibacillus sp. CAU 1738 TaxID=3140363 RepID=UPI0032616EDF
MKFSKIVEAANITNYNNTKIREAVRAIIVKNDKILLIHSNKGDYKFPGGGIEEKESHCEALIREVKEETGYINCQVHNKIGYICEMKMDEYSENTLFQMRSHYYLCELMNEEKITQQLDDYEYIQQFTPKWVSIDEAIRQNESLMNDSGKNGWVPRETFVLIELKKFI